MKYLLSIFLIFSGISLQAQNMQTYLKDTKELVTQGKYKEALERDIWFHDHVLEFDKGMRGVRLSFALNDWKSLSALYPPALAAMKKIRDQKTKIVLSKTGSVELFADVAALNRTLDDNVKTIELFKTIMISQPDRASQCWYYVKDQMFKAKEYSVIRIYIGNPMREFDVIKQNFYRDTFMYRSDRAFFKQFNENNLVTQSIQLIQYAVAVNDISTAKEVQQKAKLIVKDYRLDDAIKATEK